MGACASAAAEEESKQGNDATARKYAVADHDAPATAEAPQPAVSSAPSQAPPSPLTGSTTVNHAPAPMPSQAKPAASPHAPSSTAPMPSSAPARAHAPAQPHPPAPGERPEPVSKLRTDCRVTDVYKLGRVLGNGGFSVVKLAIEKATGKEYACKIMALPSEPSRPAPAPTKDLDIPCEMKREDIFKEIDILCSLNHENILYLKEYFEEQGKVFLIMELLTGGELFDAVIRRGSYTEMEARTCFKQLLSGIEHMHSRGVCHRDLKLENLLLQTVGDSSIVKIADFGLAKYVAPEVIQGLKNTEYGPVVDMWAAGIVLFILLGGYPPFYSESEPELFKQIRRGHFSFNDPAWDGISISAKDLISKLLVVDPAKRLTASQALQHLWLAAPSTAMRATPLAGTQENLKKHFSQKTGAQKQGITSHVKVKKKNDGLGVGAAETANRQRDWTTGMVSFDKILSQLKEVAARHDEHSEEEGSAAAAAHASTSGRGNSHAAEAGEAPAKRKAKAAARKAGKASKAKATPAPAAEASSNSSDEDAGDEAAPRPAAAAAPTKLATHVGRYHRRERAKRVCGYSADDLAAILGASGAADDEAATAAAAAPEWFPVDAVEVKASHAQDDSEDEEDGAAGAEGQGQGIGAAKGAAGKRSGRNVGTGPGGDGGGDASAALPAAKSWWSSMFVRAGRMGSTKQELHSRKLRAEVPAASAGAEASEAAGSAAAAGGKGIKISGFSEQDQENLYEKVHLGATHGKQGLGRADAPKKVAGARWCGTKTKLDSDSEGEEEEAAEGDGRRGADAGKGGSSSEDEAEGAVVVMASKKEQAEGQTGRRVLPAAGRGAAADEAQVVEGKKGKKGKKGDKGEKGERQEVMGGAKRKRGAEEQEGGDVAAGAGVKKQKKKGSAKATAAAEAVEAPEAEPSTSGKAESKANKVKWKQLARGVLKEAPDGRLKLKVLCKRVCRVAGASGCSEEALLKKLRASPQLFEVGEKFVRLL